MEFSKILKNLRTEKNLSQFDLSEQLNLSQSAIAKWELSKSEPNAQALITLSAYFNVSVDYLLGLEFEDGTLIIDKITSDIENDVSETTKLDIKNKIENIIKDNDISLDKISNLSNEQIKLIINLINNLK